MVVHQPLPTFVDERDPQWSEQDAVGSAGEPFQHRGLARRARHPPGWIKGNFGASTPACHSLAFWRVKFHEKAPFPGSLNWKLFRLATPLYRLLSTMEGCPKIAAETGI